jgi:hypothetical protein
MKSRADEPYQVSKLHLIKRRLARSTFVQQRGNRLICFPRWRLRREPYLASVSSDSAGSLKYLRAKSRMQHARRSAHRRPSRCSCGAIPAASERHRLVSAGKSGKEPHGNHRPTSAKLAEIASQQAQSGKTRQRA